MSARTIGLRIWWRPIDLKRDVPASAIRTNQPRLDGAHRAVAAKLFHEGDRAKLARVPTGFTDRQQPRIVRQVGSDRNRACF